MALASKSDFHFNQSHQMLTDNTSYGNEGSSILNVVLSFMFPENTALPVAKQISYQRLIEAVLVREAATLLIEEDLHIDRKRAIYIAKRSQAFGTAFHPGDDSIHLQSAIDRVVGETNVQVPRIKVEDMDLTAVLDGDKLEGWTKTAVGGQEIWEIDD